MSQWLERLWYGRPALWFLRPFSWLFQAVSSIRRWFLSRFIQKNTSIPIIIVGNISVGGVGKTPLVIAIANFFKQQGFRPAIVSRGYGATLSEFPHQIHLHQDTAIEVGDEPLLIAEKTGCPVVIDPKRNRAVEFLQQQYQPSLIISDDGLQHYAMARSVEIIVIDGKRGLGNGYCLPAGPLREAPIRLNESDFLVVNGGEWPKAFSMRIQPKGICSIQDGHAIDSIEQSVFAAVAGIGHPQRFFDSLQQLGLSFKHYVFPDHYQYSEKDLAFSETKIIMTEKDAVKCRSIVGSNAYALAIEAELPDSFWQALTAHPALTCLKK